MRATEHPTYAQVVEALQNAEEMGGPEGTDYGRFMFAVASLATGRALTYATIEPEVRVGYLRVAQSLVDRLQRDIETLRACGVPVEVADA